MIPLSVAKVAEITGAELDQVTDAGAITVGPVIIDSREAVPGSLFAALPGKHADGHEFAGAAVAAGAVAALVTRPAGAPALIVPDVAAALATLARAVVDRAPQLTIAAITGSAGKTTTKDLTAQLIETLGPTVSPRHSLNNEIGVPLTALRVTGQTRYLICEMAARGSGHIAMLCQITPPALGAVLCVGNAHAGEFGSIDEVAKAKGELPAALSAAGAAVLNADDPRVLAMAERTAARLVTFGRSRAADVRAADVTLDERGRPSFRLLMRGGCAPVALRLHGEHHVTNALAAAALAGELGMPAEAIAAGLSAAVPRSRWRMEVTERDDGVTVINDAYNANPESVRAALNALAVMARGRRGYAVLGQMTELGEAAEKFHRQAGARAAESGVAGLIVVGAGAAAMLAGAAGVPAWRGELLQVADGAAALQALRQRLRTGDVVLVKASHSIGLQSVALALAAGAGADSGAGAESGAEAESGAGAESGAAR
ncbi:MAG TPA: UDP-N-acetylmuramoyl-tripeptide--D-alanyl-D-alanine ligase [Streptosporangiaceae bacterium]|nr:UDP-N-acetylmuramoyl-tripeptide--D-alanyl-D-alanine ligase [Streptosporangiaceae bacterium]